MSGQATRPPDDKDTPLNAATVRCADNVELARQLGNMVLEAQAHRSGMKSLYDQLCAMTNEPPKSWGHGLVEEYERHVARMAANLSGLKTAVG